MKKLNKLILAMVIIFTSLLIVPIVVTNTQTAYTVEAASKIQLNKTKKTLYVGDTYKLKITGTNKKVKWSTTDKSIATVNANGKVKAKKKGTVTIKAKVGEKTYKCKIKVKNNYVKAGKYKLTFGTYKSSLPKYEQFGGKYTINGDGTYSYKNTWKDNDGNLHTHKHSGKYKIENEVDDYTGKVYKNRYIIFFYAEKSNEKDDKEFIKNGQHIDAYRISGNNKLSAGQYYNDFKLVK